MLLLTAELEADAALRMLHGIADRLDHPRGLLEDLAGELAEYEEHQFATSGEGTWDPLNAVTVQLKGSSQVLVDHGDLERELTSTSSAVIDDDSVELVTQHPAASYLRSGTSKMPARNPTPTPDGRDLHEWATVFLRGVVGVF